MTRAAVFLVFLSALSVSGLAAVPAPPLIFVNRSEEPSRQLTLRREGDRLVIVDGRSRAVVASASASETQHVIIRGADESDDTLTVDLTNPFSLSEGIDYDGGVGGWDSLVLMGGFVQHQTVRQTKYDGVIDLDGLVLRFQNLEPITDTTPSATLMVLGTAGADTVTVSDGPGPGEATISSPTFAEAITFANKTNVIFDGVGGADTFNLNNPTSPAGLVSFVILNVASVGQSAAFNYSLFGVSATGTVDLNDFSNNVNNIEIVTQNGAIHYEDVDDLTIGGVSGSLTGLRVVNSGDIQVSATGGMTLGDTDGPDVVSSGATAGNVDLRVTGGGSDIMATVNNKAITAPAGFIYVDSGRDLLLGTGGLDNDVRASGRVEFIAARDIAISGLAEVASDDFGNATAGDATAVAGRDLVVSGTASFGANGSSGAGTSVQAAGSGPGSVVVTATTAPTLFATSDAVVIAATRLVISPASAFVSPVSVDIDSMTFPVDLGSATDLGAALELSDAEIDRITTPLLRVITTNTTTVTQPITFAGHLNLVGDAYTSAGAGSLSAPALTFNGAAPATWTIDGTSVTISPGAAIPYSAVTTLTANGSAGDDTYNVTPAAATTININGNPPIPPASPGDTLNVNTAGTTSPLLTLTSDPNGFNGAYTFGNRAPVNFTSIETLPPTADLAVTKTDGVAGETAGTTVTYTIIVSNLGPVAVTGATVVDTFPPALSGVTWTCTAMPGSACSMNGSGNLNELVNLAVSGSVTFSVTGTISPSAGGTLSNTVTVSNPVGTSDPDSSNNTATDTDTLTAEADLSVTKTSPASSATPGTTVTYAIVLTNSGPSDAATVTLTDALPANTTFSSLNAAAGFTCTTPPAGANGTVSCTAATLAPSSNSFTLVLNVSSSAAGTLSNTATVTAGTSDPNGSNNTATETDTLAASADLSVTKTSPATSVTPGGTVTYTIVLTNSGPSDAATVTLTDVLPANTTFVSLNAGGFTCTTPAAGANGTVSCTAATLAPSSNSFTLVLDVSPSATGAVSNTATVTAGTSDPNGSNNTVTETDTLAAASDLSVVKTSPQSSYTPGGTITYTIVLTNAGPSDAATVTLTDALPASTTFASLTAAGGFTCSTPAPGANGSVSCTAATLAPSSNSFTLVVNVSASATGAIANAATVTAASSDPDAVNNTGTVSLMSTSEIPALSPGMLLLLASALGLAAVQMLRRL
jgi:uncharacterized repeat protein (TIGR01451 family)